VDPLTVSLEASAVDASGNEAWKGDVLALFQHLLSAEFWFGALRKAGAGENNRVYTTAVVMWLMIWQRLQTHGTQESAVLELLGGLPASFWPEPCKRLEEAAKEGGRRLCSHTGAYNKARQELSLPVVEQSCDHAFEQLVAQAKGERRPAFVLDGSTVRMPHTDELVEAYPPTRNQHGQAHWSILRMLVASDLYTGLAMRSEWGPMNGSQAVSEQRLLERAIDRLPSGAVVLGDSNFGVFSVAYTAVQQGHPVVLRLTKARAQRLAGGVLRDGIDQRSVWRPSRDDRRSHPELSAQACVEGRLIVRQVQPSNGKAAFLLAVFTTLTDPPEEIFKLYEHRWRIETDLRTLKITLRMDELTCTTPPMVAKELNVSLLAYNLVRAVIYLAAEKAGVEPRSFSFTRVRNVIQAFTPRITACRDPRRAQKLIEDMLYYVGQAQLPKRRNKRPSYPRAKWPEPKSYPSRHG
jgi:putative transposase